MNESLKNCLDFRKMPRSRSVLIKNLVSFACFIIAGIAIVICLKTLPAVEAQANTADTEMFDAGDKRNIVALKTVFNLYVYYADENLLSPTIMKNLDGYAKEMAFSNISYKQLTKEEMSKLWDRLDGYAEFLHLDTKAANDWDPSSFIWYAVHWFDYDDLRAGAL